MKIPKVCDVCGSSTIEGNYGESWWLCSNKDCKKNNPNWSFQEYFAPYKEEFHELDDKIKELSNVKVGDFDIEIELHEFRWIGDGSGDIRVKNSNSNILIEFSIEFYFKKDKVKYMTDNTDFLITLSKIDFDSKLKEIWELVRKRNSLFSIKNK